MPEPQRIESGITEGEDSVSSFSLELMTKYHASRRIQGIILCTLRVEGHNSIYGPLKVLNVGLQGPLGPHSSIQNLPSTLGKVIFLMVLDPSQWAQEI
ncbi:hypothetical protein O181_024030 [Austropuccinia psidii MF-1]|uniref:Uncharacterized protein n=1 Tax=Austropuccinia psidii MF-1 TaxID=1389203 RepID=A0A9Q3GZP1_9BASI|nr:hypothetical protein [Austropuccinia psidii MF-1]